MALPQTLPLKPIVAGNRVLIGPFPFVYMTSNLVRLRGAFFGVSALVLAIMWIIYMLEILTAPWV
jgi:hypothetical protein